MTKRTTKIPSSWKNCATRTLWCGWNMADVFCLFVEFETGSTGRCNGSAHGLEMPAMGSCPEWSPLATGLNRIYKAKHCEKTGTVRPDWGSVIVDTLKFCLMQKYLQSEAFRTELEKTRGLFIVEAQPNPRRPADTYSAKLSADGTTWSGPNLMGRLLMELRDNGTLEYQLPDDAVRFQDLPRR